jgi:hypothetical protein
MASAAFPCLIGASGSEPPGESMSREPLLLPDFDHHLLTRSAGPGGQATRLGHASCCRPGKADGWTLRAAAPELKPSQQSGSPS